MRDEPLQYNLTEKKEESSQDKFLSFYRAILKEEVDAGILCKTTSANAYQLYMKLNQKSDQEKFLDFYQALLDIQVQTNSLKSRLSEAIETFQKIYNK